MRAAYQARPPAGIMGLFPLAGDLRYSPSGTSANSGGCPTTTPPKPAFHLYRDVISPLSQSRHA